MKIERWDTREIIFELECDSWKDLIKGAIKAKVSFYRADLSFANLSFANLSSANLSSADLRSANLSFANLSFANLSFANLSSADLSSANLSFANLSFANLSFANLSSANLRSADLRSANLRYANGNLREVKSMQIATYHISWDYTNNKLNIGCQSHTFEEWEKFTDEKISKMDENALAWWKKWKDFIFQAIELAKDK